jgi:ribonuclease BN (tRNA processing enzyme)
VRVTFLGTGTPQHLERANAALAVRLDGPDGGPDGPPSGAGQDAARRDGAETVLLDTAGGNELLRRLRDAAIALETVHHVFVSHQHFDHAAGLPILLLALSRVDSGPLWVYGPAAGLEAMRQVVQIECPGVLGGRLGDRLRWVPLAPGERVTLPVRSGSGAGAGAGAATLRATPAVHPVPAAGCVLEWGGRRVGYSGDTAPYDGSGAAFAGVDLLIHEASGLDGAGADALHAIGHSTGSDAGRVAAAAGAARLALTHFSPLPEDAPARQVAAARTRFDGPVVAAEDLLTLAV